MIGFKSFAAGVSVAFLLSGAPAWASTCRDTCNDQHLTCERAGKSEDQCLAAWGQCKNRCDAPTLQKTAVTQTTTPTPKTKTKPTKPH